MKVQLVLNTIIVIGVGIMVLLLAANPIPQQQLAYGAARGGGTTLEAGGCGTAGGGCMDITDNNVYVAWWNNKTGNFDVIFRASNDNGKTFGPKINLSNTSDSTSSNAVIASEGTSVYVAWLEGDTSSQEPFDVIFRASNDNGKTFGPKINLSNSPESNSTGLQIEAQGNSTVYAIWWERNLNETFADPAFSVSYDSGETFSEKMMLANATATTVQG